MNDIITTLLNNIIIKNNLLNTTKEKAEYLKTYIFGSPFEKTGYQTCYGFDIIHNYPNNIIKIGKGYYRFSENNNENEIPTEIDFSDEEINLLLYLPTNIRISKSLFYILVTCDITSYITGSVELNISAIGWQNLLLNEDNDINDINIINNLSINTNQKPLYIIKYVVEDLIINSDFTVTETPEWDGSTEILDLRNLGGFPGFSNRSGNYLIGKEIFKNYNILNTTINLNDEHTVQLINDYMSLLTWSPSFLEYWNSNDMPSALRNFLIDNGIIAS